MNRLSNDDYHILSVCALRLGQGLAREFCNTSAHSHQIFQNRILAELSWEQKAKALGLITLHRVFELAHADQARDRTLVAHADILAFGMMRAFGAARVVPAFDARDVSWGMENLYVRAGALYMGALVRAAILK